MSEITAALSMAVHLIVSLDTALAEIVGLSLYVSITAVAVATLIGVPLGAAVAMLRFPGRGAVQVTLNALMGLPPVVVGLGGFWGTFGPVNTWTGAAVVFGP